MTASEFWKWFEQNNYPLIFLSQIENSTEKERILSSLIQKLHEYDAGLFFEIGAKDDQNLEFIITAGGNPDCFESAEKLVSESPKINDWRIIA